jgi:hypothetical protein
MAGVHVFAFMSNTRGCENVNSWPIKSDCEAANLPPRPTGIYPNIVCASKIFTTPVILKTLNSDDTHYMQCVTPQEYSAHKNVYSAANDPNYAGWCDDGTNAPTGAWCCRHKANTSKRPFTGRGVHCADTLFGACESGPPETCKTANMVVW